MRFGLNCLVLVYSLPFAIFLISLKRYLPSKCQLDWLLSAYFVYQDHHQSNFAGILHIPAFKSFAFKALIDHSVFNKVSPFYCLSLVCNSLRNEGLPRYT